MTVKCVKNVLVIRGKIGKCNVPIAEVLLLLGWKEDDGDMLPDGSKEEGKEGIHFQVHKLLLIDRM